MQKELLKSNIKYRINLKKETHNTISNFKYLINNIASRLTRIAELVLSKPSAVGYHNASGEGAGGVWFIDNNLILRGKIAKNIFIV
jgi:hypothetical protein